MGGLVFAIAIAVFAAPVLVASNPETRYVDDNWGLDAISHHNPFVNHHYYRAALDGAEASVNVYSVDSGVGLDYDDFESRISGDWYNFFPGGTSSDISDCDPDQEGHGTHNASIIAGSTFGVAKGVTLHVMKVAGASGGSACRADATAIVDALSWIVSNGDLPAVINLPFRITTSSGYTSTEVANVRSAILSAISYGFVVTASAGCSSTESVSDIWDSVAAYAIVAAGTNAGGSPQRTTYGSALSLFAPAMNIHAAGIEHADWEEDVNDCGDSWASAYTAGAAALVLAGYPSMSPADVRTTLIDMATPDALSLSGCSGCPNKFLYIGFLEMQAHITVDSGHYMVAEDNGGGAWNADRTSAGEWETFLLIDLNGGHLQDGDEVALRTLGGYYALGDCSGNNSETNFEADNIGSWQTFVLHLSHSGDIEDWDTFSLETHDNHFMSADGGGGGGMTACATSVGWSETFQVHIF